MIKVLDFIVGQIEQAVLDSEFCNMSEKQEQAVMRGLMIAGVLVMAYSAIKDYAL